MAYCGNCGNQVADNQPFCASCGQPVVAAPAQQAAPQPPVQQAPAQPQVYRAGGAAAQQQQPPQTPAQLNTPQPAPQPYTAPQQPYQAQQPYQMQSSYAAAPNSPQADAQANKLMGVLAYFGPLVLVPLLAAKESPFARFHAGQGLVLVIGEVVYSILYRIITAILSALLFSRVGVGIYSVISILLGLVSLIFPVLAIIGIINAAKGKCKPLPLIGNITLLK